MAPDTKNIITKLVELTADKKAQWEMIDRYGDHQSFVAYTEPNYYVLFKESFFTKSDEGYLFLTKRQMVGKGNHYLFYILSLRESDTAKIKDLHGESEFQDDLFQLSCVIKRNLPA